MLSHWTLLYSSVFLLHLSYFSSQLVSAAVAAVSLQSLTTSLSPLWVPHCCIKVGWVHYAHRLGLCRHLCRSTECQFVEGRTGSACQLQVRGHNHPPADRLLSILSFFRFCFYLVLPWSYSTKYLRVIWRQINSRIYTSCSKVYTPLHLNFMLFPPASNTIRRLLWWLCMSLWFVPSSEATHCFWQKASRYCKFFAYSAHTSSSHGGGMILTPSFNNWGTHLTMVKTITCSDRQHISWKPRVCPFFWFV